MAILKSEFGISYFDAINSISVVNIMALLKAIPPYRGLEDREERNKKGVSKQTNKPKNKIVSWEQIGF